jgi:hypothetical protein
MDCEGSIFLHLSPTIRRWKRNREGIRKDSGETAGSRSGIVGGTIHSGRSLAPKEQREVSGGRSNKLPKVSTGLEGALTRLGNRKW